MSGPSPPSEASDSLWIYISVGILLIVVIYEILNLYNDDLIPGEPLTPKLRGFAKYIVELKQSLFLKISKKEEL